MLKIRRLRLTLPPGFTGRPEQIARLVAERLARRPLPGAAGDGRIGRLAPPPVEVGSRAGERDVAEPAARAIEGALVRGR